MKFIHDNKKYDTDKAELVLDYRKYLQGKYRFPVMRAHELYLTEKNNWILIIYYDFGSYGVMEIAENEVKQIFADEDSIELYEKYFGELEEG